MKPKTDRNKSISYDLDTLKSAHKEVLKMNSNHKSLRFLILHAKNQRKAEFNKFHKESLKNSFNTNYSNSNLYITETAKKFDSKELNCYDEQLTLSKETINEDHFSNKYRKYLIFENKKAELSKENKLAVNNNELSKNDLTANFKLFSTTIQSINKEEDANRKFLYNVNDLFYKNKSENYYKEPPSVFRKSIIQTAKNFIVLETKREKSVQQSETYYNQIERIKDNISDLKKAEVLLQENFMEKQEVYVRYLQAQKDKEVSELNRLREIGYLLDIDNKSIANKIIKQKNIMNILIEYKTFLVNIKERRIRSVNELEEQIEDKSKKNIQNKKIQIKSLKGMTFLKKFVKKTLDNSDSKSKDLEEVKELTNNINRGFSRKATIITKSSIVDPRKIFKRGTTRLNSEMLFNNNLNQIEKPKIDNRPIFENVEQLKEQFKILENENVTLLDLYNKKLESKKLLLKEYNSLKNTEYLNTFQDTILIEENQKLFNQALFKNEKLHKEKQKLLSLISNSPVKKTNIEDINKFSSITKDSLPYFNSKSANLNSPIKINIKNSLNSSSFLKTNIKADKQNMFLNQIDVLYNSVCDYKQWKAFYDSYISMNREESKTNIFPDAERNILRKLNEIEACIIFVLDRLSYHKQNNRLLFKKVQSTLEKERKIQKSKEAKIQEKLKIKFLKQKIYERCYKPTNILKRRRIGKRFKPKDIKVQKFLANNSQTDKFDELIQYEICI